MNHICKFFIDATLYQVWDKCTEWSQNDLEKYKVNTILYKCTTSIPRPPSSVPNFIQSISLYSQLFLSFKPVGGISTPNDPKMTLSTTKSNLPHTCSFCTSESQISLRFILWLFVFQIIALFGFILIGHNGEYLKFSQNIIKNWKLQIWKIPNVVFWGTLGFWKVVTMIYRRHSTSIGSHINENKKLLAIKISILKTSKIPNVILEWPLRRKFRRSWKTFGCNL